MSGTNRIVPVYEVVVDVCVLCVGGMCVWGLCVKSDLVIVTAPHVHTHAVTKNGVLLSGMGHTNVVDEFDDQSEDSEDAEVYDHRFAVLMW